MNSTTPRYIVLIVVSTLSLCTLLYIGTLAWCVISGQQTPADVMREFSTAGMFLAGIFCGMLTNTRGGPAEPVNTEVTTQTVQKSGGAELENPHD